MSPENTARTNTSEGQSPEQWGTLEGGRLTEALEIAIEAGSRTLKYFGSAGLEVISKSDDSPVTVADREAESRARELIETQFPGDTVQGEEFDDRAGDSPYRWVIDPIDGTKSFVCGVPLYSTLLAIEKNEKPIAGVILIPALGEVVIAAEGLGCWHRKRVGEDWMRARVSSKSKISDAVFLSSQVDSFAERGAGEAYLELEKSCWITRTWGDGYGYLLIATGRAEVMVDPICNAWDVAAIMPVVQEAGGRFSDWKGHATVRGGDGVGTNGTLHEVVLDVLGCR
ncbi:MAG: histidinol-phosphatase [Planctomycetota bacterium]